MKVLFVGKRHPQQRDLIERPYGRFHHLPVELAARGHEVHVALCSHRRLESTRVEMGGVSWGSDDVRTLGWRGIVRRLDDVARVLRPDWVFGVSDAHFGWLAHRLASRWGARLAIDAYDNYEAYMPWNLPLHVLWRRAVRAADLVTAAGPQLARRLQSHRDGGRPVAVLPMVADPTFQARDRDDSRRALGLPLAQPQLGYFGSWSRDRGTRMLLQALRLAREQRPDLGLLLSGRPPPTAMREPGVRCAGYVDDGLLPRLVSAVNVACVVTADTRFGRYSYPSKLCEAMACAVPVVATATAPVRWMLGDRAAHLVAAGDAAEFARKALALIDSPVAEYGTRLSWRDVALDLDRLLRS